MKNNVFLPLLALCFWLVPSPPALGQTYYDYASGNIGSWTTPRSIVRDVDPTSVVAYYCNSANKGYLVKIEYPSMAIKKIELEDNRIVNDIRIVGNNVYFCGSIGLESQAFIGHVYLSTFSDPLPRAVTYYDLDPTYTSSCTRMAAYVVGGVEKVVLVGHKKYIDHPLYDCPYTYNPPIYWSCIRRFIAEVNFNGSILIPPVSFANSESTDFSHLEVVEDVVETASYLAAVCHYTDKNAISIHLCSKWNVVSDFINLPFYYFVVPDEGLSDYHACLTEGDTIAVMSMSVYYSPAEHFATTIRCFDLQSMTNTVAQRVETENKNEPLDMLYMPETGRLVVLQEAYLPSILAMRNLAINVEPYNLSSYNAKCWYEPSNLLYSSLARLNPYEFAASGRVLVHEEPLGDYTINWVL